MKFLTEVDLAREVAKLVKNASEVRIAVAFWGMGGGDRLRLDQVSPAARILCNLPSGACNPAEVEVLRKRHCVHSHEDLHAKVYWTPTAAIVGSSNASTNGLAVSGEGTVGWREANVLIDAPAIVAEIADWFEAQWADSKSITDQLLQRAKLLWKRNSIRAPTRRLAETSQSQATKRASVPARSKRDSLPDADAAINAVSRWRGRSKNFVVAIGSPLRIHANGKPVRQTTRRTTERQRAFVEELRELAGGQRAIFQRGTCTRGHVIFASSGPLSEALELGTVEAVAPDPDTSTYNGPKARFRLTGRI